jgi:hypothetical protein
MHVFSFQCKFKLGFITQFFKLVAMYFEKNVIRNCPLISAFPCIFHLREHLVKYQKGFSDGEIKLPAMEYFWNKRMSPNGSTKHNTKYLELIHAVPLCFWDESSALLQADAELTSSADVNEQFRMKLVWHCYFLLVFLGREGRLWDGCQGSKVKLFTMRGLLVYLLNCPDIHKVVSKTNASCLNSCTKFI